MITMRTVVAIAALLAAPYAAAQQPSAPATPAGTPAAADTSTVMAVWVERKIYFPYAGFTALYSCDGLRNKVRAALTAIGAKPGFEVTANGCPNRSGPEPMPSLDIVAAMPREAAADEAKAPLPARWRRISFSDDPMGLFQAGDCELVEQLRDKVFVPLGARIVSSNMICVPRQVDVGAVDLTIEVLEPVSVQ
jgi:hypothetical protein